MTSDCCFHIRLLIFSLMCAMETDCLCFWYQLHGGTIQCRNTSIMEFNSFTVQLPNVRQISHLKISETNLHHVTSELFNKWTSEVTRLKSIDLSDNHVQVVEYFAFDGLREVVALNLADNRIDYLQPLCLAGLETSLVILDLSNNWLTTLDTTFLSFFSRLRSLYLNNNLITSIATSTLPRHPFLTLPIEHLNLSHNHLTAFPKHLLDILYRIETLDVSNNKLQTINFTLFTASNQHQLAYDYYPLSQLAELYLHYNELYDLNIVENLDHLPNLRLVQFEHNQLLCKDYNQILFALINSHVNVSLSKTIAGTCVDVQMRRGNERTTLQTLFAIDLDILIIVLEFTGAVMIILVPTFLVFYLIKWICFRTERNDEIGLRFLK